MYGMVPAESPTEQVATSNAPLDTPFRVYERFLKSLETLGGRILILLVLVVGGYGGAAVGLASAESLGSAALIVLLLVLARDPRSPGVLNGLLALLRRSP